MQTDFLLVVVFSLLGQSPNPLASAAAPYLLMLWITVTGACIGSFLNVVIYRVPVGLSVVYPGSHCPRCTHPIRGYDNIPVVSWFLLRGKCRDCGLPISRRYPLVEVLVAVMFLAIFAVDVHAECATAWIGRDSGPVAPSTAEIWVTFLLHAVLASTLFCAMMMEYDGQTIAKAVFVPVLALRITCLAIFPRIASGAGPLALLLALGLGVGSAWFGNWICRASARKRSSPSIGVWSIALVSTSLTLGWTAFLFATVLLILGLVAYRACALGRRICPIPSFAIVLLAALVTILVWRPIHAYFASPRYSGARAGVRGLAERRGQKTLTPTLTVFPNGGA